jgi:hypothetical protein
MAGRTFRPVDRVLEADLLDQLGPAVLGDQPGEVAVALEVLRPQGYSHLRSKVSNREWNM